MIIKNLLALANLILFLNYFPHSIRAEVHDMQVERVRALGQPAVSNLMLRLKENLSGALINSGPVGALKFCNSNAEKLKEQTEATLPSGLKLKRTAERVRNPNNAPDQAEKLALEYFKSSINTTNLIPNEYIQEVVPESEQEIRYYKPIIMAVMCLTCHGKKSDMSSELVTALKEHYPSDQATEYQDGEFRGVVRVSIPKAMLKE